MIYFRVKYILPMEMEYKLEEILHRNYGTSEPNESDSSEMTGEATAETYGTGETTLATTRPVLQ